MEYVFLLAQSQHKLRADIDNRTRSQEVVVQVHRNNKEQAKKLIATWLKEKFDFHVEWPREYSALLFHMDAASKEGTNKFEDEANTYVSQFPPLQESLPHPPSSNTPKAAPWSDLSKVK